MKRFLTLLVGSLSLFAVEHACGQSFTRSTLVLADTNAHSGGCMGVADMDDDGYDDVILLDQSKHLYIEYQASNGTYTQYDYGQVSSGTQWGMAVGDVDNNGHKDFFSGGNYDGVHLQKITSRGVSSALVAMPGTTMFMQCANMADINNDGWLDAFGCHDDGAPHVWFNDGAGNMVVNTSINFATNPVSDMSGNYGSIFTDFDGDGDLDFYISHCRQGVTDPNNPLRWNRLFVNNGSNSYTDMAGTYGLQNHSQSWATDFGDIDNDGDLDALTVSYSPSTTQLFLNDGTSHFTDVTAGSGLTSGTWSVFQVKFEDLDNDTYLDVIMSGNLASNGEHYYHNNGNGTFTEILNMLPEPGAGYTLQSFGLGDLNHDGFIDVYAGYGTGYVTPSTTKRDELYLNNGNANHWLNFQLKGTTSNRDGVGARVTLYGPWGRQIREIKAGESYGIVTSFTCHFGLGANLKADSAVVHWPSGTVDRYKNLAANQWVSVTENSTHKALVSLKAMLEGPFNAGLMNDDLRTASLIPSAQPYAAMGFNAVGGGIMNLAPSILAQTGNNAIVDWVWVELRDKNAPGTILRSKPALIQRDGDVVEVDGVSNLYFGMPNDLYYLAIRHRNHFGCMTSSSISLSSTTTVVNFTLPGTATWGNNARKDVGGTQVLWAGDVQKDGTLKYTGASNDRDPILLGIGGTTPTNTATGYLGTDVNLDGTVKYTGAANDRDPILVNIGGTIPTNTLIEQLP